MKARRERLMDSGTAWAIVSAFLANRRGGTLHLFLGVKRGHYQIQLAYVRRAFAAVRPSREYLEYWRQA